MALQKFEIIVNAMLGWSEEARSPRKSPGRHAAHAPSRFAQEDEDDEMIDDDGAEPDEELRRFPQAGARPDAELAGEDESEIID